MSKFYKIGFFVLLALLVGGGSFYLGSKYPNFFVSPTPTPLSGVTDALSVPTPTSASIALTPSSKPKNTRAYVKENVVAAINTGNTQALEGYMTGEVVVIIEASECCGKMTRAKAIEQLSYIKDAKAPWNFDDANPIATKLRANSPNYGDSNSIIGIASNEYVVAVILNGDNKIKGITMAVTYKLVAP